MPFIQLLWGRPATRMSHLISEGNDYEQMQNVALAASRMLREDPHARDVSISYKAGQPNTMLDVDRDNGSRPWR